MIYSDILLSMEENKGLFNYETLGTEVLLYTLMDMEDSMTSLILKELNVSKNDVLDIINSMYFLRKDNDKYTSLVYEIIENAKDLEKENDYVYDEAYLYSLIKYEKNTVASEILKRLHIENYVILDELNNALSYLESQSSILENITLLAKNKKIGPFIGRGDIIDKIDSILSRKKKNNCILLGDAGVGKSGIVEGLAFYYLKKNENITIYSLDIGHLLSGTKYRGDLEERLMDVIDEVRDENVILFIDEIHNIVSNNNSENSLDIASILKPILARNSIRCIGATTLYEYNKYIYPDKALTRRFKNIYVNEASFLETFNILKGIKVSYEDYHNMKYSNYILKEIVYSSRIIPNNSFPDKAIDVLDDVSIYSKKKNHKSITKEDLKNVIFENLGVDRKKSIRRLKKVNSEMYDVFSDYLNINPSKNYIDLKYVYSLEEKEKVINNILHIFDKTKAIVLEIDFYDYDPKTLSASLFGSANGYVGYDEGGILSNHLIKNPFNILVFKNYSEDVLIEKNIINKIINDAYVLDNKANKLRFMNSYIIIYKENNKKALGF